MRLRGSFATIRTPGRGHKYFECPVCRRRLNDLKQTLSNFPGVSRLPRNSPYLGAANMKQKNGLFYQRLLDVLLSAPFDARRLSCGSLAQGPVRLRFCQR